MSSLVRRAVRSQLLDNGGVQLDASTVRQGMREERCAHDVCPSRVEPLDARQCVLESLDAVIESPEAGVRS